MKRILIIFSLLAAIVALPVLMRRDMATADPKHAQDRLIIITPHNESIRNEFGNAFARWWREKTGRSVYVDWRTPGGSAEIRKVIDAGFTAAKSRGVEGMGVDIFFGGGDYEFESQAKVKRLAPLAVFHRHPEWFGEHAIMQSFSGEKYYNDDRTWVAACLSQFGIVYNEDGIARNQLQPPQRWEDLGDEKNAGYLALSDPSKSGTVARSFELLIQQQMQQYRAAHPDDPQASHQGWKNGWQLILRLCANARYFTDSASKIPQDVGQGDAVAGMCVDFYGRSFSDEWSRPDGSSRLKWIPPQGGSSLSGDPIAVFQGAPNAEVAQAFVEFVLSDAGQVLWNARQGSPNGPALKSLRRMPVRRDVYTPENIATFVDGKDGIPYDHVGGFVYQPELTSKAFRTIRNLIRVCCIDSHEEMKDAWKLIRQAGMPQEALDVFLDVSAIDYATAGQGDARLDSRDAVEAAQRARELGHLFRSQYLRAGEIARRHLEKQAAR